MQLNCAAGLKTMGLRWITNKALPALQTNHCVGRSGKLSFSSTLWLMSKSQITHGLLCRRALAQAAARAVGIYQLCELRVPSELKAHNRIIATYHNCGDRGIMSKASYTASCSGTGNTSTGRILGEAPKN